jgi:hypothetical protein
MPGAGWGAGTAAQARSLTVMGSVTARLDGGLPTTISHSMGDEALRLRRKLLNVLTAESGGSAGQLQTP